MSKCFSFNSHGLFFAKTNLPQEGLACIIVLNEFELTFFFRNKFKNLKNPSQIDPENSNDPQNNNH